jgi:aminoglycoside phosphotransferase (APT) family kinase protein
VVAVESIRQRLLVAGVTAGERAICDIRGVRHGYTNRTDRIQTGVRKSYEGPDAPLRGQAEYVALTGLAGRMPVPAVLERSDDGLVLEFVEGVQGQELIEAGHGSEVLSSCGALLRRLHDLDPALVGSSHSAGVICHGDFGPNNVLLDPATFEVTALIDWEFCGAGDGIVDLAWCEWIVRMHHPAAVEHLPAFFDAYGERPPWPIRHRSMLDRCRWLEAFCRRANNSGGVHLWQDRARATAEWTE